MSTKRIDLSRIPNALRTSVSNRSIKVKRLDRNSNAFTTLSATNTDLAEAHFIAFSPFCCTVKRNHNSTFALLGDQGQLVGHMKLNTASVKEMVRLATTKPTPTPRRRKDDK